ncbi:MAG: hypothetical protein ACAH83_16315 [Alphaproteobacteria bacterium]
MKQLFNWLGKKSDAQPTLGYAVLRPVLGKRSSDDVLYNIFKLKNGGRLTERAIFLSAIFTAAAVLPLTAPVALSTVFLAGAAAVAGKTVGILAGKVTDFFVDDINHRVIPRREAKRAAANKPQA